MFGNMAYSRHYMDKDCVKRISEGFFNIEGINPPSDFMMKVENSYKQIQSFSEKNLNKLQHSFEREEKPRKRACVWIDGSVGAGKTRLLETLEEIFKGDISIGYEHVQQWEKEGVLEKLYENREKFKLESVNLPLVDAFQRLAISDAYMQTFEGLFPPDKEINRPPRLVFIERGIPSQIILWPNVSCVGPFLSTYTAELYADILKMHAFLFSCTSEGTKNEDWNFEWLFLNTSANRCLEGVAKRGRKGEEQIDSAYLKELIGILSEFGALKNPYPFHRKLEWQRIRNGYFNLFEDAWNSIREWSDFIINSEFAESGMTENNWWESKNFNCFRYFLRKRLMHFCGALKLVDHEERDRFYPTLVLTSDKILLTFQEIVPRRYRTEQLYNTLHLYGSEAALVIQFTPEVILEQIHNDANGQMIITVLQKALYAAEREEIANYPPEIEGEGLEAFWRAFRQIQGAQTNAAFAGLNNFEVVTEYGYDQIFEHDRPYFLNRKDIPPVNAIVSTYFLAPECMETECDYDEENNNRMPINLYKNTICVKLLHENARLPECGSQYAAGYDLFSAENTVIPAHDRALVKTGIQVLLPQETYGRIAPRSGLSLKKSIDIGAGVIDPDYTGELSVLVINNGNENYNVSVHDRIAQLICEKIAFPGIKEEENLKLITERGSGGFGSTGI